MYLSLRLALRVAATQLLLFIVFFSASNTHKVREIHTYIPDGVHDFDAQTFPCLDTCHCFHISCKNWALNAQCVAYFVFSAWDVKCRRMTCSFQTLRIFHFSFFISVTFLIVKHVRTCVCVRSNRTKWLSKTIKALHTFYDDSWHVSYFYAIRFVLMFCLSVCNWYRKLSLRWNKISICIVGTLWACSRFFFVAFQESRKVIARRSQALAASAAYIQVYGATYIQSMYVCIAIVCLKFV